MRSAAGTSLVVILLLCSVVAPPLYSQTQTEQCLLNYEERGTARIGRVLATEDVFSGVDVATALRRLQVQLPGKGLAIRSVDSEDGVLWAESTRSDFSSVKVKITLAAVSSGTRVRFWSMLRKGMLPESGAKLSICEMLQLATVEPPPPPPLPAPRSIPAPRPEDAGLTNQGVVALVEADLGDEIVIAKLKNAPKVTFDLSTEALQALKKAKVSSPVIAAMIERAARPAVDGSTKPGASVTASATTPIAPIDSCAGVELLGLYKNEIFDRAMGGGVVEWLAKIRNNSAVTKIVVFGWKDSTGQQRKAQVQIQGGEIATPRVDMTQARYIAPVTYLQVLSCQ